MCWLLDIRRDSQEKKFFFTVLHFSCGPILRILTYIFHDVFAFFLLFRTQAMRKVKYWFENKCIGLKWQKNLKFFRKLSLKWNSFFLFYHYLGTCEQVQIEKTPALSSPTSASLFFSQKYKVFSSFIVRITYEFLIKKKKKLIIFFCIWKKMLLISKSIKNWLSDCSKYKHFFEFWNENHDYFLLSFYSL